MWFVVDGCGILASSITYALLIGSNAVVLRYGIWPWGHMGHVICRAMYEVWFAMCMWSHMSCMLSDPGAVAANGSAAGSLSLTDPCSGGEEKAGWSHCHKCNAAKPPRAHHCSTCRRCILKMDHHCPFVNNCVGARNQKPFLLFLVYLHLQCWAAIFCLCSAFASLAGAPPTRPSPHARGFLEPRSPVEARRDELEILRSRSADRSPVFSENDEAAMLCAAVIFVAVIFGLFSGLMICDQASNIASNTTGVDSLKGVQAKARPVRESVYEVLGGRGPSVRWLIPTPLRLSQVKDDT
eukprot:TRINITY_DN4237_c0_g1_i1.p1 TRINITY_DN4237_c0_g1~~TRINITY_DN4237_c0_g1_i1.p1  ORF type:complete len:296 (-),score=45.53 TRINITY_DN4237_c0_g1_i1:65-952(-)